MAAYQTVTPLKLGELWAIPIMLRLALIENLVVWRPDRLRPMDRDGVNSWADQIVDAAEHEPKNLVLVLADMARTNPPMVSRSSPNSRALAGQTAR